MIEDEKLMLPPTEGNCDSTKINEWQDLTEDEMKLIAMQSWNSYPEQRMVKFDSFKCQRLTQAKLKEKNT